jgi:biopolymer transport protein ExbB
MIERIKSAMVGLGASWVLWLMLVLSVVSLAIMLERAWMFWSLRDDIASLMRDLGRFLRAGDLEGARQRLEQSPSAVVVAGIVEADLGPDAAEEAMAGASALQRVKLERRLAYLGTLGNNAPFIGLLGTVIGIVGAFEEFGKGAAQVAAPAVGATAGPSEAVMRNIAEALVATAVGLIVAIPAVFAFNTFQRIVKTTLSNTDALGHVLLAHLKARPAEGAGAGVAPERAPAPRAERAKAPAARIGRTSTPAPAVPAEPAASEESEPEA